MKEQQTEKAALTPKKRNATTVKRVTVPKQPAPPSLKMLVTVVNREKAELFAALLQSFEINFQFVVSANGTANTEMLRVLGLADSEKAVIFSLVREDRASAALRFLEEKFETIKNGKGIAYTIPLTGTIGVAIYQFLSNSQR